MSETGWWGLCDARDARDACQDTHDWGFISGYPIDREMGMGPESGPWDSGSRSRTLSLVGTGYFLLPVGQNFDGVVTSS